MKDLRVASAGPGLAPLLCGLALKKSRPDRAVTIFVPRGPVEDWDFALSLGGRRPIVAAIESCLGRPLPLHRWRRTMMFAGGSTTTAEGPSGAGIAAPALRALLEDAASEAGCRIARGGEPEGADFDWIALESDSVFGLRRAEAKTLHLSLAVAGLAADRAIEIAGDEAARFFAHGFVTGAGRAVLHIEAGAQSWTRRGLDTASPTRRAQVAADLFARSLAGQEILGLSRLEPTAFLRPASWRDGRRVLLGGAALAAPGCFALRTEIALREALALASSLAEDDVAAALARHEATARRTAESAENAAALEANWSEHVERYLGLDPPRLAFAALTRSLRVNHRDLARQSPDFVRAVDCSFAGMAPESASAPPPPMFVPLVLRGLRLENRIGVSPMCMYMAEDGTVNDFHLVHLGSRAMGGAALVMTEMTDVSPEGRITVGCAGMYKPEHVAPWRRIVDYVHRHTGAKIGIQLAHAGRRAATARPWHGGANHPAPEGAWETIGPSPIAFAETLPAPREMTGADIDRIIAAFEQAARWSEEAGFDLLEIHMAHGYLLSSFLSPLSNLRRDAFGGGLAGRARFPLEVARAVRAAWPAHKPLSARISAVDWAPGGSTIEDMIEFAAMLKGAGTDIVCVSTGNVVNSRRPAALRLFQTPFSDQIRNAAGIPTMTVGRILSYGDINAILAAGRADLCLLARGHLNDPYFTRHAAAALGYDPGWPAVYRQAAEAPLRVEP